MSLLPTDLERQRPAHAHWVAKYHPIGHAYPWGETLHRSVCPKSHNERWLSRALKPSRRQACRVDLPARRTTQSDHRNPRGDRLSTTPRHWRAGDGGVRRVDANNLDDPDLLVVDLNNAISSLNRHSGNPNQELK